MCSSSVGAQSGIFKVSSDINCIPSAKEKQLTHSLSLPIAPVPISVQDTVTWFHIAQDHLGPWEFSNKDKSPSFHLHLSCYNTLKPEKYFLIFILWSRNIFSGEVWIPAQRIWVFPYITFRDFTGFSPQIPLFLKQRRTSYSSPINIQYSTQWLFLCSICVCLKSQAGTRLLFLSPRSVCGCHT